MARQKRRKGVEHKQATREEKTHAYHQQEAARKLRAAQARQQWEVLALTKEREHMNRLAAIARRIQNDRLADSTIASTEVPATVEGDSDPDKA